MAKVAKAITAAVTGAAAALTTASTDGRVTTVEWLTVVGAALVAFGAVWAVPNAPPTPR